MDPKPELPIPGRSLVTRRAVVELVRRAVSGSYGVTGFTDDGLVKGALRTLRLVEPGIRVSLQGGVSIDLRITVAQGLPVAEVARQVDSAVRYAVGRALERDVDRLAIHVGGLRFEPASFPPAPVAESPAPADAAVSEGPGPDPDVPDPEPTGR